jgi:hypothetical protein
MPLLRWQRLAWALAPSPAAAAAAKHPGRSAGGHHDDDNDHAGDPTYQCHLARTPLAERAPAFFASAPGLPLAGEPPGQLGASQPSESAGTVAL